MVYEPRDPRLDPTGSIQLVEFILNNEKYALNIEYVKEISPMLEIRPVPKAPEFVEGVINLRGDIRSVIDLRKRFELPINENIKPKIIMVELDEENIFGFIVDQVEATISVKLSNIDPRPSLFNAAVGSEYIYGVAKVREKLTGGKEKDRLVIVLDLPRLLNADEWQEFVPADK
ncbi:chemotaxis protein CheW [Candidatus Riflebacteria bacterium]